MQATSLNKTDHKYETQVSGSFSKVLLGKSE